MQRNSERDALHGSKSEAHEMKGKVNQMKFYCGLDQFTTTDEFPEGYIVWNVGEYHAPTGYIPLCKLKKEQYFDGGKAIETDSLLALPVSDEVRHVIMKKARRTEIDRKKFERIVKNMK